ncbi:hypothetical protein ACET3Z_016820 [Daucus carota]
MLASRSLVSSNFLYFPPKTPNSARTISLIFKKAPSSTINIVRPIKAMRCSPPINKTGRCLQICHSSQDPEENEIDDNTQSAGAAAGGNWTTSVLLFFLWGGLMFYIFNLAPNQTPSRDMYFLKKLLNLQGDDGFHMNEMLVSLWYIMGLWPLVYSMLLLPFGRSSKSIIPVWPFLVLSCFGGAYALFPYFILWRPPSPPIEEAELSRWPLNFLESKLTAGLTIAAGLGLIIYAGLAGGDVWTEFYQYFRESKFIHLTCIDFSLLSAFAPFWVYNDMTARKWDDKGIWLLPVSVIPFLGPSLYILLRPSLSALPISLSSSTTQEN